MAVTADGPDAMTGISPHSGEKVLVAGYCVAQRTRFCIARFNSSGELDQTFVGDNGDSGKFTINVPEWRYAAGLHVVSQHDGKILIAGVCEAALGQFSFCVMRLLADGRLDPSFVGPTGIAHGAVYVPLAEQANFLTALTVQNDGQILLSGICSLSTPRRDATCLARLRPDGSWDAGFAGPSGDAAGAFVLPLTSTNERNVSAISRPDMSILLVAGCATAGSHRVCVARLNRDGSFDTTFNAGGTPGKINFLSFANVSVTPTDIALQPDDKLLIAGNCEFAQMKMCVGRLTPQGMFDPTFTGQGGNSGSFFLPVSAGDDYAHSVRVQSDGKILLAGRCVAVSTRFGDICMARLHGDGALDTSFDGPDSTNRGNGMFHQNMGPAISSSVSMLLQSNGQIMHVSTCTDLPGVGTDRVCLARIHGGPQSSPYCSMDIDGDGVIGSPADALIAIRSSMGFTNSAVFEGIVLSPHATRRDWASIHSYLSTQCGMRLRSLAT